jgi:NAD(P)-dependent dehydrogenase (short-subunit alcohol dehydrogenase family)
MANLFDLTGKVALITGGNGGIGLGMAEGLAQHGATVIIWGTNEEKNAAAAEALAQHGGIVRTAKVDVSDEDAVKAAMADIIAEFGRIDQAIANAGIGQSRRDMFDISREDFEKLESINVHGVFFTLREAARHMIDRDKRGDGGGSLVAVASTAAIHGAARNEHYGATKGAVVSMCRAMAVELARHKITVNSICPGWIKSDMTAGASRRISPALPSTSPAKPPASTPATHSSSMAAIRFIEGLEILPGIPHPFVPSMSRDRFSDLA